MTQPSPNRDLLALTARTVRYLPVVIAIAAAYTLTRHTPEWLLADGILYLAGTLTSAANLTFGLLLYRRAFRRRTPLTRGARMSTFLGSAGVTVAVFSAVLFLIAFTINGLRAAQ